RRREGAVSGRGRIAGLGAVDRAQRADGRRLVARHPRAQQARHGNRRDDADDRDDDQELDEREPFASVLHGRISPPGGGWAWVRRRRRYFGWKKRATSGPGRRQARAWSLSR